MLGLLNCKPILPKNINESNPKSSKVDSLSILLQSKENILKANLKCIELKASN